MGGARPVEPPAKAGSTKAHIPLSARFVKCCAAPAGSFDLQLNRDGSTVHHVGQSFYPFVTNGDSESRARRRVRPSPSDPASPPTLPMTPPPPPFRTYRSHACLLRAVPGALNIETSRPTWQPCQLKSIEVAAGTVLPLASATPLAICDMSLVTLGLVQGDTVVEVAFADGARLDTTRAHGDEGPGGFRDGDAGQGRRTRSPSSRSRLPQRDWLPFLVLPDSRRHLRHDAPTQHAADRFAPCVLWWATPPARWS